MSEYPPSGVLFTNERKQKETSPDYTGQLELSDEVVSDLVDQISRGETKPSLSLAGWKKTSRKTGKVFLSLVGSIKRPPQEGQQSAPASQAVNDEVPF